MITLLSRMFIKDRKNYGSAVVRRQYGLVAGVSGIMLNILLFTAKIIIGILSGAVSIISDAFNNLSDAFSNIVTIAGFAIAGKKADEGHPYGHGRAEYVSGLIVALVVILIGAKLFEESIRAIRFPKAPDISIYVIVILILSICVKLYMFFMNKGLSKKINSPALSAAATDSVSDCAATGAVLFSSLLFYFSGINIDGICGAGVSIFIMISGIRAAKETIDPLLGEKPDPAVVSKIKKTAEGYENVIGVHDISIHDYGPGKTFVTLHAEMPAHLSLRESHEIADEIERKLSDELSISALVHMDPVSFDDPFVLKVRNDLSDFSKEKGFSVHDVQVVYFPGGEKCIDFDVIAPYSCEKTDEEIKGLFLEFLSARYGGSRIRVSLDRSAG